MKRQSTNPLKLVMELAAWLVLAALGVLIVFTIASNTEVFGGYKSYLVQSGSMEPAIMTGDIIVVHKQGSYAKNDVITFMAPEKGIVTHRIMNIIEEKNTTLYNTKGDANRTDDSGNASINNVIGKVVFVVPKLGFFVGFAQSPIGLIALVLIPAGVLVLDELVKIVKEGFG